VKNDDTLSGFVPFYPFLEPKIQPDREGNIGSEAKSDDRWILWTGCVSCGVTEDKKAAFSPLMKVWSTSYKLCRHLPTYPLRAFLGKMSSLHQNIAIIRQ